MIREIVVVDDPRLRTKCPRVPRVDDSTRRLIDDMVDTMRDAPGIGLAAPQIGVLLRVIVCEVDEHLHVLVNPEIIRAEGEQVANEGCLSIPGWVGEVRRAERVVVKGKNRVGKDIRIKAEGLLARCLQHEIDHVDGILFTDRLTDPRTFHRVGDDEAEQDAEGGEHPTPAREELVGV
ncbi:MAG TPA: peptide deformylase [Candidatus Dormibacteraeota bacterium]|jgi:peptide deformylase|nr:peptide deformylase [Candidatus Dormibacteraeota bacterium]